MCACFWPPVFHRAEWAPPSRAGWPTNSRRRWRRYPPGRANRPKPSVFPPVTPGSCAWPFTKPAATRSRASTNWRSSAPTAKRTWPWPNAAPWPARRRCFPAIRIHQIKHLNDGLYGNDHSWIAATGGRGVGADRIAQAGRRGQRGHHARPRRASSATASRRCRGARLAGWAAVAVGRQARADRAQPRPPLARTSRSTGCRRRPGTDSCSTRSCASGRPGATSRPTITCRRCWSTGRPCPAGRRTGAASRGWRRWSACWCSSRR